MNVIIGVFMGAVIGSVMGYYGKCRTGACPLTSTPVRGAFYGAFIGLVLTFSAN